MEETSLMGVLCEGEKMLRAALAEDGDRERVERDLLRLRALARANVRAELSRLAGRGYGDVAATLSAMGCRRLSELPTERYPELLSRMEASNHG